MSKSQERRLKIQKTQTARQRLRGVFNQFTYYGQSGYDKLIWSEETRNKIIATILSDKEAIKQIAREMPAEDFMEIVKERVEVDKEKLADFIPDEYCDVGP